jgi:NO-binding membrane sensor protein with MHYT domain
LSPLLAGAAAVTGTLLGLVLLAKARGRPRRARVRLLLYATVALGGVGIWQPHAITLLAVSVPGATVRCVPVLLLAGLGAAFALVAPAAIVLSRTTTTAGNRAAAGVGLALAVLAAHHAGAAGLRVGGPVAYHPVPLAASVVLAGVTAWVAVRGVVPGRRFRSVALAATGAGAATLASHYALLTALRVPATPGPTDDGLSQLGLFAPVVLAGAAVAAMLAFFTFGTASARDVRLIYDAPGEHSEPIEPWMIAEVLSRTAVLPPPPRAVGRVPAPPGSEPAHRPMRAAGWPLPPQDATAEPRGTAGSGATGEPRRFVDPAAAPLPVRVPASPPRTRQWPPPPPAAPPPDRWAGPPLWGP